MNEDDAQYHLDIQANLPTCLSNGRAKEAFEKHLRETYQQAFLHYLYCWEQLETTKSNERNLTEILKVLIKNSQPHFKYLKLLKEVTYNAEHQRNPKETIEKLQGIIISDNDLVSAYEDFRSMF